MKYWRGIKSRDRTQPQGNQQKIDEVCKKAAELGMTYGEYVASVHGEEQKVIRKLKESKVIW